MSHLDFCVNLCVRSSVDREEAITAGEEQRRMLAQLLRERRLPGPVLWLHNGEVDGSSSSRMTGCVIWLGGLMRVGLGLCIETDTGRDRAGHGHEGRKAEVQSYSTTMLHRISQWSN